MGVLDAFDSESETGEEYTGLLKAADVAPKGQDAVIVALRTVKLDDGTKPAVLLRAKFAEWQGEKTMALILKRSNGNRLAVAARNRGGEGKLIGAIVHLTVGETEFRGKPVPTVDLTVGGA